MEKSPTKLFSLKPWDEGECARKACGGFCVSRYQNDIQNEMQRVLPMAEVTSVKVAGCYQKDGIKWLTFRYT